MKQARGVVVALAGGMERYGDGPAAQAQVRVAQAAATAGFAVEDLKTVVVGALDRGQKVSGAELVRIIELDQQQQQQVAAARTSALVAADGQTDARVLAVLEVQPAMQQWMTAIRSADSGSAGDPKFFVRTVDDYRTRVETVTEVAAFEYSRNARDRLHQNWFRLAVSVIAGLALMILLGLAWWWDRRSGSRMSSSGGETMTTPSVGPVRSEVAHA